MRNVKTRNECLEKLWGRYVSDYVWSVNNLRQLLRKRHESDKFENDPTLNIYAMISTQIRELRVSQLQIEVSNIQWSVINREHPRKYAEQLVTDYL